MTGLVCTAERLDYMTARLFRQAAPVLGSQLGAKHAMSQPGLPPRRLRQSSLRSALQGNLHGLECIDIAAMLCLSRMAAPADWARTAHKVEVDRLQQAQVHDVVVIKGHLGQAHQPGALFL